jgi:hypothetical protein
VNPRLLDLEARFRAALDASDPPVPGAPLLKAQVEVLARVDELSEPQKRRAYVESMKDGLIGGDALGPSHPARAVLAKMLAIAEAVAEGRPEPTDAELEPAAAAPPAARTGCLSLVVLALSAGLLGGAAWRALRDVLAGAG